jgi:predicted anti-sigma-YlaC factor YlaD
MRCERVRRSLYRFAEGEAAPAESLLVARHLPDCTACRILLARERRLQELLEDTLDDPVGLDQDFLTDVMSAIAGRPAPRRRSRRLGLAVKLAIVLAVLLVSTAILSGIAPSFVSSGTASLVPSLEPDSADGPYGPTAGLARLLLVMLDRMVAVAPPPLSLGWPSMGVLGALLPGVVLGFAVAGFLAFAARSLCRE